ncbi:MAG: PAS domain S-box protein [Proteobacteria bacterium]|nr:PAS domain S-box protein [Pseudomonadota bacterium]MCH8100020.1 PAS domain S-box protein [Pseudomonadota bacterium]
MPEHNRKLLEFDSSSRREFLGRIAESVGDAIISADEDGNIRFLNTAARGMFGYGAAEIIGRPVAVLIPECRKSKRMTAKRGGDGRRIARTGLRKDGEKFPIELTVSTLRIDGDEYFAAIVRDVSEQVAADKMLRLLEAATYAAANATIITDGDGLMVWVNPAFTALTGYTAEEALGRSTSLLKSGEQDESFYKDLWSTILAGKTWRGTLINRRKNGSVYSEQQAITPVRDPYGEIRHFVAIKEDITEAVQTQELLRKSGERYRRLFENSPLALWEEDYSAVKIYLDELKASGVTDFQDYFEEHPEAVRLCASMINVVDVNAAAVKMLVADNKNALIGELKNLLSQASYADLQEQLVWLIAGNLTYSAELVNQSLSGESLHVDLNLSIAAEFSSCWSEVLVCIEDISERKMQEKRMTHAMKMEAVGQLTGGVAHDFNNVLTVISGNLRLLADLPGHNFSTDMREMLNDALSAADDGARLTSRLLAFSRISEPHRQLIDINSVVDDFAELLRSTLGGGVDVDTRLADDLARLHLDRSAFGNALMNLSLNANDAMPDGGRLTFSTRSGCIEAGAGSGVAIIEPTPCVIVEVADTGCGMSADVLARATEPFFTTKDLDEGSGLGLSMVYEFIRECGGDLKISSTPGAGTTIALYLPLQPAAEL